VGRVQWWLLCTRHLAAGIAAPAALMRR
jgi:hypothetical protein